MDLIRIFDTTLRDGEQAPGFSMSAPEKMHALARQLESLGVDVDIEAGFPIASRGDLEGVRIAVACRKSTIARWRRWHALSATISM